MTKGSFKIYNITVQLQILMSVITSDLKQYAYQSLMYNYQIVATNYPILFSADNLPIGLTLDQTTGIIKGMPLVSGNFEIRLKVLNEGGESGTILFLTINPSLLLTEYF